MNGPNEFLPASYWVNGDFTNTLNTATYEYVSLEEMFFRLMERRQKFDYVSPDGTTFIPSDEVFVQGPPHLGYKWAHILQAFGLAKAIPGKPFYVTNEAEQKTYRAEANADGSLGGLRLFANQGGESVAQDRARNVYLAAGQIFVYSPAGKTIERIEVPERPPQLVFGGKDSRTLFVLTQSSLYATRSGNAAGPWYDCKATPAPDGCPGLSRPDILESPWENGAKSAWQKVRLRRVSACPAAPHFARR